MNNLTWEIANQLIADNTEEIVSPQIIEPPLLSVCLITYNQHQYIRQGIESIICQKTDFSWEVIISDDGSVDGTTEIVLPNSGIFCHSR